MATQLRVALIGDYNPAVIAHQAIPEALRLSADANHPVEGVWVHTGTISNAEVQLRDFDGFGACQRALTPTWKALWKPFDLRANRDAPSWERAAVFSTPSSNMRGMFATSYRRPRRDESLTLPFI